MAPGGADAVEEKAPSSRTNRGASQVVNTSSESNVQAEVSDGFWASHCVMNWPARRCCRCVFFLPSMILLMSMMYTNTY